MGRGIDESRRGEVAAAGDTVSQAPDLGGFDQTSHQQTWLLGL